MSIQAPGAPVNRLPIKEALFTLATSITFSTPINGYNTWGTSSRRLKEFPQVDKSIQPAMYMVQHKETVTTHGVGRLTRRYLDMGFWCYAPTPEGVIGDDILDIFETAFETVLQPDDPGRVELTLGGLCYWCRITREDGLYIRDPGDIDGQALLILPVRILLP